MAPGIFTDPFVEGLCLVGLGIVAIVAGILINGPELRDVGKTLIGAGLGYFMHSAVTKQP